MKKPEPLVRDRCKATQELVSASSGESGLALDVRIGSFESGVCRLVFTDPGTRPIEYKEGPWKSVLFAVVLQKENGQSFPRRR